MKIVLGVDDSPHSRAATEYVAKSAWPKGTRVIVVAACPPVFLGPGEATSGEAIQKLMEEQAAYYRETSEKAAAGVRKAGLEAESRMILGDPRSALVETAKEEHADLIAVGSHGRTGLGKFLLGSVASHVVSHAPCSVLVVKLKHP
jgi:nucleotide-binding universal stress UspA family protein